MDDAPAQQVYLAKADLETVLDGDELPAETAARLQRVLPELRYDRVVLCREGHPPPFEFSADDVRQIEAAVERLPGTEDERREARLGSRAVEEEPPPRLPKPGDWPCQQGASPETDPRLVAFLYRLLRDGAQAPGHVEEHAIQARLNPRDTTIYTNPHIEAYARALAASLTV